MKICDYSYCTGCFACRSICPKNAIIVDTDKLGKTIPAIQEDKCVSCGMCQRVCPVNNPVEKNTPIRTIAAWSKNEVDVKLSSSGGVATVISRSVINNGGTIFGASSIDATVKHIKITQQNELELIRGSKYVQSATSDVFCVVKNELKAGKKVVFIGTPCQIAGLKNFLNYSYDNLYTVDLICHGTPPVKYLEEYLECVCNGRKWNSVSFRGKYNYSLTAFFNNEIIYQKSSGQDLYFDAFMKGLSFRDNCYKCQYACPDRVSDITVADFWGIDRDSLINKYDGRISLVLINTNKGKELFDIVKDDLVFEDREFSEAVNPIQTNINRPSVPHKDRELFETMYKKHGFYKAVKSTSVGKEVARNKLRFGSLYQILKKIKQNFNMN